MARVFHIGLNLLVMGLLFAPFGVAVFAMRNMGGEPSILETGLLLLLLIVTVAILRHKRLFKIPENTPTLYD